MRLDPKHLTLNGLLQGRLFRIPDYQRAYAWGQKQRKDLFDDIHEVRASGQDHFMATIVCLARDKRRIAADEYQVVDVVDGQQRLTTFIMLLKAIEKSFSAAETQIEHRIKRDITDLLVKGDDNSLVLLQTNHDSSRIFIDYLRYGSVHTKSIKTSADQNLVDAANECESFVSNWRNEHSIVDLVAILRNRLSLIYHELSDEASVYRVFEVLNSRGLDVKWIDKLKSQLMALIFAHAESRNRAEALKEMYVIWKDIYQILGVRGGLGDDALRFAGTLRSQTRPNRLLSQEDAAAALAEAAGTQLRSILEVAGWLRSVVSAVDEIDRDNRLRAVTRISHARFLAASILLLRLPSDIQDELISVWERVTFRVFSLGGADTRYKVGDYIRLGYDVASQKIPKEEIKNLIKKFGKDYPADYSLDDIDYDWYTTWTVEELRYLLFRYDEHLALKSGESINKSQWNKIWADDPSKSIEHIEPQSSRSDYIHSLGNLTMLPPGKNSSLGNKKPTDKASAYESCGIRATSEVGEQIRRRKQWTKKMVEARTAQIYEFIRKEWAD